MRRGAIRTALGLALILVVAFCAWRGWLQWRLAAVEGELRAAGWPVTVPELIAHHPSPGRSAASELLEAVCADLRSLPMTRPGSWDGSYLPIAGLGSEIEPGDALPVEILPEVEAYLAAHGPVLLRMAEALETPGVGIPFEAHGDVDFDRTHLSALAHGARAFELQALYWAQKGDAESAMSSATAVRQIADVLGDEPTFVSQLRREMILTRAMEAMEHVLCQVSPTPIQIDVLAAAWSDDDPSRQLRIAWQSAFCSDLDDNPDELVRQFNESEEFFGKIWQVPPPKNPWDRVRAFIYAPRVESYWLHRPADLTMTLESYRDLMTVCDGSPSTWVVQADIIRKRTQAAPPAYFYTTLIVPAITRMARTFAHSVDRNSVVSVVLAIERYRIDHGRSPGALEDLMPGYLPAVPHSAFTQLPLVYILRDGDRYTVSNTRGESRNSTSAVGFDPLSALPVEISVLR